MISSDRVDYSAPTGNAVRKTLAAYSIAESRIADSVFTTILR
jgi:hypothetical protein